MLSLFLGSRGAEVQLRNLIEPLFLVASHVNLFRNIRCILAQEVVHGLLPVETHIMQELRTAYIG